MIRKGFFRAFILMALMWGMGTAAYGDVHRKVNQALRALKRGDALASWRAWEAAEDEFWKRLPLSIKTATFTKKAATGWGMFDPHSNRFKAGEMMYIYVEPIGYRYSLSGSGRDRFYHMRMKIGVKLSTQDGQTLFSTDSFGMFDVVSRRPNKELFFHFEINIPANVRAGKYQLSLIINDLIGNQYQSVTLPFVVTP